MILSISKPFALILFLAIISIGCTSYVSKYYFEPTPGNRINPDLYGRFTYSLDTDQLKFRIDPDADRVGFWLFNNSSDTVYIVWNDVRVINKSDKLEFKNFSPSNPDKSLKLKSEKTTLIYTVLLPGTNYSDEIGPIDLLAYKSKDEATLDSLARKNIGTQIKVIIPIKVKTEIIEYSFPFDVVSYQILRKG